MAGPHHIPKNRAYMLHELTLGLCVIRDALDALRNDQRHHLLPLSGQLRALLTERSKKAKPPLLLSLAREIGLPSDIYVMKEITNTDGLVKEGLIYQYIPAMLSYRRSYQNQIKIDIESALDTNVIEIGGRRISLREIIMRFAQQAGGVHFEKNIDRHLFQLMVSSPHWIDVVGRILCETAALVLDMGSAILKKVVSQSLYMLVSIPDQNLREACPLLDAVYPRSAMRLTLLLSPERHIELRMVDYMGIQHHASSRFAIELGHPMVMIVSIEPRVNLSTDVRVIINDEDLFVYTTDRPLEVYQDFFRYDVYINKFAENQNGSCMEMGLSYFLAYQTSSWAQRGQMVSYMLGVRQERKAYWWLSPGQFAHKQAGKSDFVRSDHPALRACGPRDAPRESPE